MLLWTSGHTEAPDARALSFFNLSSSGARGWQFRASKHTLSPASWEAPAVGDIWCFCMSHSGLGGYCGSSSQGLSGFSPLPISNLGDYSGASCWGLSGFSVCQFLALKDTPSLAVRGLVGLSLCQIQTSGDILAQLLGIIFCLFVNFGLLRLPLSEIVWSLCLRISDLRGYSYPAVGQCPIIFVCQWNIILLQLSGMVWSFCSPISGLIGYSGSSSHGLSGLSLCPYPASGGTLAILAELCIMWPPLLGAFCSFTGFPLKSAFVHTKNSNFSDEKPMFQRFLGELGGLFTRKTRFRTTAHQNMRKLIRFWTTAHRENRKNIRFCTTAHQRMRKNVWLCICEVAKCSKILGFARMRINISLKHNVLHLWVCKMS